jgi:cell division protein FtsB
VAYDLAAENGMIDDTTISRELAEAARQAIEAKRHLQVLTPRESGYQAALISYLQATVLHLSVVSVAQARQYENLAAEVDELRDEISRVRAC